MQLSDFILSTEPEKDLADAAKKAGESPATIAKETQYWKSPDLVGTLIGGEIYLLQTSANYQYTKAGGVEKTQFGDIPEGDFARLGGSFLRHENYHKSKSNSEYEAYSEQKGVLGRINNSSSPFVNQAFFSDISNGIQNKIQETKKSEGIK